MIESDRIRIVIIGGASVGKTAIVQKFLNDIFQKEYKMTMAGEIHLKNVKFEGEDLDLIINDTPGEIRFKVARDCAYPGARGALLIFDLTRLPTFNPTVRERLKELWVGAKEKIPVVIIGNKNDLINFRSIRKNEIEEFCKQIPCPYIEISAKTGEGVQEAFKLLLNEIKHSK